jgi:D-glycero-D-manno-heptose 1,7-bisphosphate phosphatase
VREGGTRAVFLDRDGTIIQDRHYLRDPGSVTLLEGAAEAIRALNEAGYPVVVATNQSGIGRGYFTEDDYRQVQDRLASLLAARGARLDAVYHCPHGPSEEPPCDCRKPREGLFRRAAAEMGLDLARSHYVGDRVRDVLAGVRWGGTGYLLSGSGTGENEEIPLAIRRVGSLWEAVAHILGEAAF